MKKPRCFNRLKRESNKKVIMMMMMMMMTMMIMTMMKYFIKTYFYPLQMSEIFNNCWGGGDFGKFY